MTAQNKVQNTGMSVAMTAVIPSRLTLPAMVSHNHAIPQKATKRTKVCSIALAFILAALLGECITTELRAQVIVVPNALATIDGNDFDGTPSGNTGGVRVMRIFDASQFGALSGPSLLTQIATRPDTIPGGPSGPRSPTLRIYASTTKRSVANMSTTFAENLGTNTTLVFDGTLLLTTANLPGPGNTRQFDIVERFTTPFLYDPAAGNLVLDLQISSGSGPAIRSDAVFPTIGTLGAVGSPTAAVGDFVIIANVTQFTFESPPLATIRASQVEVCWNSISNVTYQVQYRSDLTTNLWTSLVDCFRSTGALSCISDPVPLGQPQRFYRVALTNCVPQ
jgi:hypothetical protein